MEKMEEKWKRFPNPYQPIESQNFKLKYYRWNNYKDGNMHFGKSRNVKHYLHSKYREREMENHCSMLNLKSSNKKEKLSDTSEISKKMCPWSEEAMEEERKRQVSDTANKLMSKLKIWNIVKTEKLRGYENMCSERTHHNLSCDTMETGSNEPEKNKLIQEDEVPATGHLEQRIGKVIGQQEKKFILPDQSIPHKKAENNRIMLKNNLQKSHCQSGMSENKQKKIQQSLIGELMTIPKSNLEKVLANPKIHPKIEQKMAQIVKENRLLLAQKFRSLTESKINQQGQFVCSKFVDDVGGLIDSDLAVDLCQLPPELISQISNIFQLDFDSSLKITESLENSFFDSSRSEDNKEDIKVNRCENLNQADTKNDSDVVEAEVKILQVKTEQEAESFSSGEGVLLKDRGSDKCHNVQISKDFQTRGVNCYETEPYLLPYKSSCRVLEEESDSKNDSGNLTKKGDKFIVDEFLLKESANVNNCNFGDSYKTSAESSLACDRSFHLTDEINLSIKKESETGISYEPSNTFSHFCNSSDESGEISVAGSSDTVKSRNLVEEKLARCTKDMICPKNCSSGTSTFQKRICKNEIVDYTSGGDLQATVQNFPENKDRSKKSIEAQTDLNLMEADHSQPFLKQLNDQESEETLINEVQIIDDLIHRLNQRRFIIFLKLVGLKSYDLDGNNLKTSLMQAITNSDEELLRELGVRNSKSNEWCGLKIPKMNRKRKKTSDSSKISKKLCSIKVKQTKTKYNSV